MANSRDLLRSTDLRSGGSSEGATKLADEDKLALTIQRVKKSLSVEAGGRSYIIRIGFAALSPEKTALIANAFTKLQKKKRVWRRNVRVLGRIGGCVPHRNTFPLDSSKRVTPKGQLVPSAGSGLSLTVYSALPICRVASSRSSPRAGCWLTRLPPRKSSGRELANLGKP
jgi:hypothetical protein